jgi:hypothetical protein
MSAGGGGFDVMERYWAMPPITRLVQHFLAIDQATDSEQIHHHSNAG